MLWNVDPWRELERMKQDIDRLFEGGNLLDGSRGYPPVNVYDTGGDVVLHAELPGLTKEDIGISFADGTLTISGERKPRVTGEKYQSLRNERSLGEFEKSLKIPYSVIAEKISAEFKNGILAVTLPKAEEAKPKKIAINVN